MCGIVGYIGRRDAAPILIEGLHRLEYRGYDSAGIAVAHAGELRRGDAARRRSALLSRRAAGGVRLPTPPHIAERGVVE